DAAHRVRQQPEPRQPRPFRVARSAERLRRRPAPRPLRAEPRRTDCMTELRGVVPITATPFDAEGRVDEDSIVTLVEFEARPPRRSPRSGGLLAATGVAVPDILVKIYDLFAAGNAAGASEMYDRYASYIGTRARWEWSALAFSRRAEAYKEIFHGDSERQGAHVRRLRHGGRLAVEPHPGRRGAWQGEGPQSRLGQVRRLGARSLPAGHGRGAQRPPAVDESRRPPPGEPRQAPGSVRHQGSLGGRDRSLQSRLAPPRSLARLGARAHAPEAEVRAGDALERQRGPHGEHGQIRRASVGRCPRRRGGAALQAAARVLPDNCRAPGAGAPRGRDGGPPPP